MSDADRVASFLALAAPARLSMCGRIGILVLLIAMAIGPLPAWSQDEPVRSIALEIVDREVEGDLVPAARAGVVRVEQGDRVEIRWRSDEEATVHLHGYDIETRIPAGGEALMSFVARATGRFPIESHGIGADHHLEKVLLYLEVHPR